MLILAVAPVGAQERVLTADRFQVPAGEEIRVGVRPADQPAGRLDWPAGEVRWLFLRQVGVQRNYDRASAPAATDRSIALRLDEPGFAVVGLDTRARREMSAPDLRKLAARAAGGDLALPASGKVEVEWNESMKLFLAVQPAGADAGPDGPPGSPAVISKSGQAAEIRFVLNPLTIGLDSDVPVLTYLRGDKHPSRLRATHVATGRATDVDAERATAHFRIDAPGLWQVEAWFVAAADGGSQAAWTVHHASAVFEVPQRGGGR